jgi:phage terminase large subunit-like protein
VHNDVAYVTSIEEIGTFVKWDFNVPELHNYYAGGVINHNSSKTFSGACEDVWYALGNHPYKKIETPNEGWIVSPSFKQQIEGVQTIILRMLPKSSIKHISHVKGEIIESIWVVPYGLPYETPREMCSKITFKSSESGVRDFAGAAKRWIHFDEEPKREIWKESIARIGAGLPLDVWMTMTPIFEEAGRKAGMTWTYRELYQKRDGVRIATFGVGIDDNIYLSPEQIEEQKRKYFGKEYDIRIKGEFHLLAGNQVFDPDAIERHMGNVEDPKVGTLVIGTTGNIEFKETERGYLKVWKFPNPSREYAIGADIGLGVGGDPSAAIVRTMKDCEQVAELQGQIAPDIMASYLQILGLWYNKAWLGVEANSFGIATIDVLKRSYSKLYYRYKVDQRTDHRTKQIGWWTDTRTKPIMIADYGQAMREDTFIYRSAELLDECMTYVIKEDGTSNAEQGCHDDRVIADMICFQVRKRYYHARASSHQEEYTPSNKTTGY